MDFRSLEVFVWVATLRSFRRAAAKLHTTQPAVSQRIAQLEADLGVRLLDRTKTSVTPTEQGRRLLPQAERMLHLAASMRASTGSAAAIRGHVRLGVAETIVHTWLPLFVERVATAYPNLVLEIEVDITPNMREQLARRELDLAFLLGPVADMHNRPLCRFPLAFLASPALGLGPGPHPLDTLLRHPLVSFSRRTQPHHALVAMAGRCDTPLRLHASASLSTVLRMAVDGIGIAVVPPAIAGREIEEGQLVPVICVEALPDLEFTASWPEQPGLQVAGDLVEIAATVAARG